MPEATPSEDVTAASGQQAAMGTKEPPVAAQEAVVAKGAGEAAKSALALVYDRDGNLAGVTESASIVQRVAKADDGEKKAMQAVFDQDGDLIGIVDPDAIQPVTGAGGPSPSDADGDGTDAAMPAADDTDMTPQPPADTGTPADMPADDNVTKQDGTLNLTQDVLKSIISDTVTVALGAREPAEDIAKQADVAGLRAKVDALLADVEVLKEQPAVPKVFVNGQVPPARQLRGQDEGAVPQVDVAKALDLKHEMYTADPVKAKQIHDDLSQMARDQLAAIHRR